jgi:hypothetical protein
MCCVVATLLVTCWHIHPTIWCCITPAFNEMLLN